MGAEIVPGRGWQQGAKLLDWGFGLPPAASVGHLVTPDEASRLHNPPTPTPAPTPAPAATGAVKAAATTSSGTLTVVVLVAVLLLVIALIAVPLIRRSARRTRRG